MNVAARWCDALVIVQHGCRDRNIVGDAVGEVNLARIQEDGNADRCVGIHVIDKPAGPWMEMDVRQEALEKARSIGATHIAIIDADEALTVSSANCVRRALEGVPPGFGLNAEQIAPWDSDLTRRRMDSGFRNGLTIAFTDHPRLHWKAASDGYQYHNRPPSGLCMRDEGIMFDLKCFHFQHLVLRRLIAKAVWYKMIEMLQYPGRKTPMALNEMYDWTIRDRDRARFELIPESAYFNEAQGIDMDAVPWQEAEVRGMLVEHGRARFAGIDFHGLDKQE